MDEDRLRRVDDDLRPLFRTLMSRCDKARIRYELDTDLDFLQIFLKSGRQERALAVLDQKTANLLINSKFERFNFVEGYDAICSYEAGTIEALVRRIVSLPRLAILRRLLEIKPEELGGKEESELIVDLKGGTGNYGQISVSLGIPSKDFESLH